MTVDNWYLGNLDKPFNFLIRLRKQPYNNTTGYRRSETETRSREIFTRFLGASEKRACFLFRVTTEAVKFSIGDIKFYNVEFDPGSG